MHSDQIDKDAPQAFGPTLVLGDAWAIIELAPDAVLVVSASGTIDLANRSAVEMFGYERDQLIGLQLEMLLPEDRREAHRTHRASYVVSPEPRAMGLGLDLWARHRNGSAFPVEISLSPVTLTYGQRFVAIVRDQTPHRVSHGRDRLPDVDLGPFEGEMKAALIENERANDALRHFLAVNRANPRAVIERILGGASPSEALHLENTPRLRDQYVAHLKRFEESRKQVRFALFRWAISRGVSASKLASGLGVSRQMAVRLAREARIPRSAEESTSKSPVDESGPS